MHENNPFESIIKNIAEFEEDLGEPIIFSSASEDQLSILTNIGVPKKIVDFYRFGNPVESIRSPEIEVTLYNIKDLFEFNMNAAPGMYLLQYKLLVIAHSSTGDGFCIKRHEVSKDQESPIYVLPVRGDFESIDGVNRNMIEVAPSFTIFLERYADEDLPWDYFKAKRMLE